MKGYGKLGKKRWIGKNLLDHAFAMIWERLTREDWIKKL